ncbi:GntR family transcriptional regulator [Paraburkholderia ginsengiterrae]|uniref:GntR family transcriptional regulator n=2 Tax=Paraburkholderia ginsengiterrae TaxID=1462993 RepID=A0A1A9N8U8_9BURK|nr:GntR family transcriptional regulator [Paraburkholderia ginsengiterrae]OAJ61611.1 GntR family transcriptional regulator [Paraburkholderia ginsengiterrae]
MRRDIAREDEDPRNDAAPTMTRLSTVALRDRVYTELANALRSGRFVPSATVTIRGLAESLGTSTMPVREAVSRLVTEGALDMLPNRTLRVPTVSVGRLDELIDARAAVESHAAARAAERMTPADFTAIKAANEAYSHAVDAADVPAAVAANERMHFAIYRAAKSDLLVSMIEMLWLQSGPYLASIMKRMQAAQETLHDRGVMHHFNILAALAKRDPIAAAEALKADILDAGVWYRQQILTLDESADLKADSARPVTVKDKAANP